MKTHQLAITTLIAAAAFAGGFVNAPCRAAAPDAATAAPASGAVYGKEETVGLKTIATAALAAATAGKKPEAVDRKSTRLNSSHLRLSRMPSSA